MTTLPVRSVAGRSPRPRRGVSLLEFAVSSLIVGILMLGMASSVQLVTRTASLADGPASRTTAAARCLEEVIAELRLAQVFQERDEHSVTFSVPDRNGDAAPEKIRFHWNPDRNGTLQQTLTMSNDPEGSITKTLLTEVADWQIDYQVRRWGPPAPPAEIESAERLLIAHDDFPQTEQLRLLLVVVDADQPERQERARQALVESWGYRVHRISADASAHDFRQAWENHDLIYVSETVVSDVVGQKLREAPIGLVNEEPYLADELGLADALGRGTESTLLEETIGTHYLTYGWLPGEPRTMTSSPQPVRCLSSQPERQAPDLEILASRRGEPALAVVPAAGELFCSEGQRDVKLGVQESLADQSGGLEFAERYLANRWTLDTEAECFSMSADLYVPLGSAVRLGIYQDVAGRPGTLVAETPKYRAGRTRNGWLTVAFDTPPQLPPGKYWLALGMEAGVRIRSDSSGGRAAWADTGQNPVDGMMAEWSGTYGPAENHARYALHLTYDAIQRAAGRRVQLPWGTDHLQVDSLTDSGRGLLRRALQWAADPSPVDQAAAFSTARDGWPAQYFFPSLPSNATGWKLTRLFCKLKGAEAAGGGGQFRLAHADLQQLPSSFVIQEATGVSLEGLPKDRFEWFEIPLDATGDLRPDRGLCLILVPPSSGTLLGCVDQGDPQTDRSHLCVSRSGGTSWNRPAATHDLRFYAYGKLLTAGEPQW